MDIAVENMYKYLSENGDANVCKSCSFKHFDKEEYETVNYYMDCICDVKGCKNKAEYKLYPLLSLSILLGIMEEEAPDYQIGEYKGEKFLIMNSGYEVEKVEKRCSEMKGEKVDFDEVVAGLCDHNTNWGFDDEYVFCYKCNGIIHLNHDEYWTTECERFCGKCVENEFAEEYLKWLINEPNRINLILKEQYLIDEGFVKQDEEYAHGFYGAHDNPNDIMEKLLKEHKQVLFSISSHNPFEISWYAWTKDAD